MERGGDSVAVLTRIAAVPHPTVIALRESRTIFPVLDTPAVVAVHKKPTRQQQEARNRVVCTEQLHVYA